MGKPRSSKSRHSEPQHQSSSKQSSSSSHDETNNTNATTTQQAANILFPGGSWDQQVDNSMWGSHSFNTTPLTDEVHQTTNSHLPNTNNFSQSTHHKQNIQPNPYPPMNQPNYNQSNRTINNNDQQDQMSEEDMKRVASQKKILISIACVGIAIIILVIVVVIVLFIRSYQKARSTHINNVHSSDNEPAVIDHREVELKERELTLQKQKEEYDNEKQKSLKLI